MGGLLSVHPDYLSTFLNVRQLLEWAAYERMEPFDTERGDSRSAFEMFLFRDTLIEDHKGTVDDYRLRYEEKERTEAAALMQDVADMFSL